ncbi:phosphonate degradation HD-domain oxygenase [Larkinella arboricola]|uniref:Phosphonate degradation associated HDIG domain protein n=1 Tax=Larkinella arboricola TaxID=643671 RepID=A0A327WVS3_LARAB|nr:phosphonate degradation HD-domain oxygenase [Larkinella arboricola]RAJ95831.1 phosphonate degradation associated HDIG domain protein [Larkinella arboricola]
MTTDETISEITELFEKHGADDYYGEPVSQLEHMLQSAMLAERAGADDETIIAAFLHDIGHLLPSELAEDHMDNYGRVDHEKLGADWLRERGFSEKVAQLIEHHVNAKRYLTYKHPAYFNKLSEASLKTLEFQGGPMTEAEAHDFEQNPYFRGILQVRGWDEQAKETDVAMPSANHYLDLCRTYLESRS